MKWSLFPLIFHFDPMLTTTAVVAVENVEAGVLMSLAIAQHFEC